MVLSVLAANDPPPAAAAVHLSLSNALMDQLNAWIRRGVMAHEHENDDGVHEPNATCFLTVNMYLERFALYWSSVSDADSDSALSLTLPCTLTLTLPLPLPLYLPLTLQMHAAY